MSHTDLWVKVLKNLKSEVKKADFLVWFQGTNIIRLDDAAVVVGLPSIFAKDWFDKRYSELIKKAVIEIDPKYTDVVFEIDTNLSEDGRGVNLQKIFKSDKSGQMRKLPNRREVKVAGEMVSKMLNPKYSLVNFVVGADNRLAHAACSAVAHKPGEAYNPLFIYGGVGLGKTHLLQATGNEMLRHNPSLNVVYGTAEKFTNEIVDAIRKYNTRSFHKQYRKADCLIIDDIQFFANKGKTQEEFFHTFNELYDGNKQIIISSDRPPKELAGIEDRLVSRFEMGMIVDVSFPDFETRLAILQRKCQERQVIIAHDVLEYIAFNCHHNIRELEGVLLQAIARAKLQNSTPSLKDVDHIFERLGHNTNGSVGSVGPVNQLRPANVGYGTGIDDGKGNSLIANRAVNSSDEVFEKVVEYFNITKDDLLGGRRSRDVIVPRQITMYLLRQELDFSYEKIGEVMGGRNHTTAMHAYNKVVKKLSTDQKLVRDIGTLKRELGL